VAYSEIRVTAKVTIEARGGRTAGISPGVDELAELWAAAIPLGQLDGQVTEFFHGVRTIGGGGFDDLDVVGGLSYVIGGPFNAESEVVLIVVRADVENAGNLTIGGNAQANPWSPYFVAAADVEIVRPGGMVVIVTPEQGMNGPTAGTGDVLRIAGTVGDRYELILAGRENPV